MPIIIIDNEGGVSIERGRREEERQEQQERTIIGPDLPLQEINPDGHIIERERQGERVSIINILG